tara:strand:+ start:1042 stop:3060 length:2019 start_codon:yes stop_codon:yes gene_type:complete
MYKNKNLTSDKIFALALENHLQNNFDLAVKLYNQVIKIDPYHADAHINLGVIFINLSENEKAIDYIEKAIKIKPDCFNAHNNLGVACKALGYMEKSISCYEKAIEIDPNHIVPQNNLGKIFYQSGKYTKALSCFEKAIQIDPDNSELINNLTDLFRDYAISKTSNNNNNNLEELFLFLLRKNNIFHTHIIHNVIIFLLEVKNYNQIEIILNSKTSLLNDKITQNFLKEELLHLLLQKSFPTEKFLEKLLTKIRYEILFTLENSDQSFLKNYLDFIISLAEQCWFNEYVYSQNEKENQNLNKLRNKIENDNKINELEIAILGCYVPLNNSKIILKKLLNYQSSNILFNDLIDVQIKAPLKEIELAKSIKSLDKIADPVSINVREQYEENPYPRWRYTNISLPENFSKWINAEINPNKITYNKNFDRPNVLVAGGGTGKHTISAIKYKNANILSVDLSLTSIAYAKRKTDDLGLDNIQYLHADILQLKNLNKKFDVIECSGTLHHMKDPVAGLKVLLDILHPHGYLKLGLYSQFAREHVVKTRKFIKKENFNNTVEDIKTCRQLLMNEKVDKLLQKAAIGIDFYSVSSVRDLLFHVQEHRFKLPEISQILKKLNLEFLGFIYADPLIKKEFSRLFPNDKKNISLNNWHKFEEKYPDTFANMYQFWVRKKKDILL